MFGIEHKNLWFTDNTPIKATLSNTPIITDEQFKAITNDTGVNEGDIVTSVNASGFEFRVRSIDPATDKREALIYVDGLMDGLDYGFIYISDIASIRKPGEPAKYSTKPFTAKEKKEMKSKFQNLMNKRKFNVGDDVILLHANLTGNTYSVIDVYDKTPSFIKIKSNNTNNTQIINVNDVFLA
jgi:hypothetical protein